MAICKVAALCMAFRGALSYDWDTTVPAGAHCELNTGGTCKLWGCSSSYGKSYCVKGKCFCNAPGAEAKTCFVGGQCRNIIAGSCGGYVFKKECAKSLGPVDCLGGHCVCRQHTYYVPTTDVHAEGCVPEGGYRLANDGESLCKQRWEVADIKLDGKRRCSTSCCKFQVTNFPWKAKVWSPEYCVVESGPLANQTAECQPKVGTLVLTSTDTAAHVENSVPFSIMVCLSAIFAVSLLVAVRLRVKAQDVQVNKGALLEQ